MSQVQLPTEAEPAVEFELGGHTRHELLLAAAGVDENVLTPHCVQDEEASAEKEPELHDWHVKWVVAPTTVDEVPAAQLVQVEAPPSANDPASH